jgi:hypothetical protein
MRAYLFVIAIIVVMIGGYVALLPVATWSDAHTTMAGVGPF